MSMLKRVDWLVGSTVLSAVAAAWAVIVGVDALGILLSKLDMGTSSAFVYVAWTVPRRMAEMFGPAAAIGGVLGLGALAPTAELTAMRAGGMSKLRIVQGAALGIGVLLALVMVLSETLAPYAEARAQVVSAGARARDLVATGRIGLWARDGGNIINARGGTVTAEGVSLSDVRVFEFNADGTLARLSQAKRALHRDGRWTLEELNRYALGADDLTSTSVPKEDWPTALDPRLLSTSIVPPRYLSLRDLAHGIEHLEANRVDATPYRAAFWARLFYPLDVLALAFASLPFAFGALRSGGFGKRLFLGVMLAVGWTFFQRAAVDVAAVYGVDFRIAHALPIVLVTALSYSYFRRTA